LIKIPRKCEIFGENGERYGKKILNSFFSIDRARYNSKIFNTDFLTKMNDSPFLSQSKLIPMIFLGGKKGSLQKNLEVSTFPKVTLLSYWK
jgi:hypothetical protein